MTKSVTNQPPKHFTFPRPRLDFQATSLVPSTVNFFQTGFFPLNFNSLIEDLTLPSEIYKAKYFTHLTSEESDKQWAKLEVLRNKVRVEEGKLRLVEPQPETLRRRYFCIDESKKGIDFVQIVQSKQINEKCYFLKDIDGTIYVGKPSGTFSLIALIEQNCVPPSKSRKRTISNPISSDKKLSFEKCAELVGKDKSALPFVKSIPEVNIHSPWIRLCLEDSQYFFWNNEFLVTTGVVSEVTPITFWYSVVKSYYVIYKSKVIALSAFLDDLNQTRNPADIKIVEAFCREMLSYNSQLL